MVHLSPIRRATTCCGGAVGAAFLVALTIWPASAATRVEKTFGKWSVVCVQPDNEPKTCSMVQTHVQPIKNSNKNSLVLRWTISVNKDREQTQSLVVPPGVSIKEGVRLFLGDAEPKMIEYSFFGRRLCLATAPFDAKAAATVEASKKVSASYVRGSKQLVQVPLDLSGFREAYDFIMKQLS
jgi:invasion protein IalB